MNYMKSPCVCTRLYWKPACVRDDQDEQLAHLGLALPPGNNSHEEARFLADMAEFDRQMDAQQMVTVFERIGCPVIIPPEDLAPADVVAALDELIDCFIAHNICIDFFWRV